MGNYETIQGILLQATHALGRAMEYHEARLQAELLLAHLVGVPRAALLARLEESVKPEFAAQYAAEVARRAQFEPLAYILGYQEFFGLDLIVDRRVLIPRHESELLVSLALERLPHAAHHEPVVVDVGTGSGALALSMAHHVGRASIIATDISAEALEVARLNVVRLEQQARVQIRQGDLLEPVSESFDLLMANLPYIPSRRFDQLPREVRAFEPRVALDGGEDGFAVMGKLLSQLRPRANRGAVALLEISEEQGSAAVALWKDGFTDAQVSLHKDIEGMDRVVEIGFLS